MKFKVGDTVRILEGTKMLGWSKFAMSRWCGEIGIINEIGHMPEYQVKFKDGEKWCFNEEDLEIATEVTKLENIIETSFLLILKHGRKAKTIMTQCGMAVQYSGEDGDAGWDKLDAVVDVIEKIYGPSKYAAKQCEFSKKDRQLIWPIKSEIEVKLEELEKQQREIADKIAELRKEIK